MSCAWTSIPLNHFVRGFRAVTMTCSCPNPCGCLFLSSLYTRTFSPYPLRLSTSSTSSASTHGITTEYWGRQLEGVQCVVQPVSKVTDAGHEKPECHILLAFMKCLRYHRGLHERLQQTQNGPICRIEQGPNFVHIIVQLYRVCQLEKVVDHGEGVPPPCLPVFGDFRGI